MFSAAIGIATLVLFLTAETDASEDSASESATTGQANATSAAAAKLEESFPSDVETVLRQYCSDCHGSDDPEAALDLSVFDSSKSVKQHLAVWQLIRQRVADGEMPPQDYGDAPTAAERNAFLGWIDRLTAEHIKQNAGDPGEVLAHRLSAAEYDYTIRDLTGVDIRPASEFPIDPSNTAGFDNSGESLNMTPSLMSKYVAAARKVSEHLLFLPDGLEFAPHPVVAETDRDKFCVRRIVDFYQAQNTDVAVYLFAAGRWLEKRQSNRDDETRSIEAVAERFQLSAKYLRTIVDLVASQQHHVGPIKHIRQAVRDLPGEDDAAREQCEQLARDISELREQLTFEFPHLRVDGINRGSQPLVLWRNRQKASHRMKLNVEALEQASGPLVERPALDRAESDRAESDDGKPDEKASAQNDARLAAYEWFCRVFPDRFYVDRRGREYVDRRKKDFNRESEYRLLSAGFHSMMGYFRDDQPLCELMLDERQNQTLDKLWFELDFIADAPARQHSGFIWFERAEGRYLVDPEFDPFRSADKHVTSEEMIDRLREVYIAKAKRLGADEVALQAMREHFKRINASIRAVESARRSAQQYHLDALLDFARRAYRRPLTAVERDETRAFYRQLVEVDGLNHQDAVRDVLVSILVSPHFCYRLHESQSDQRIAKLDDHQLASRLSYFLWSSMPDEELFRLAEQGKLRDPQVIDEQVKRMLADERVRGLAVEFAGNWLGFRQFGSHTGVDQSRFPQFDEALQAAMFEEPVRFTLDLIRNDRSVLDFLYADHTFVNRTLAEHYGIPLDVDFADEWVRVEDAARFDRGGVLPMAVFLTKNSPGLRTSPVKRGFWVVSQLLGTKIPAPPPDVPDLPEDESKLGDLTLREVLAKHREHPSCAGCHEKFDSFGLAFEGFGPIGERRQVDLGGNPVDTSADLPDGSRRSGVSGLRSYLRAGREDAFTDTLCRKLLAYALGRSLILSDEPLVEDMKESLRKNGHRFQPLVTAIVTSPQFLSQRGTDFGTLEVAASELGASKTDPPEDSE
jgi:hypothetical protein